MLKGKIMTEKRIAEDLIKRFINFITFANLPIKRKFLLFALGVLFWFAMITAICIVTLIGINKRTDSIVNHVVPQGMVVRKITEKLQELNINVADILKTSDAIDVVKKAELSKKLSEDIKSFLSVLLLGGQINDIQRETGKVMESFTVESVKGDNDGKNYINNLTHSLEISDRKIEEIVSLKMNILDKGFGDNGQLLQQINEYKKMLGGLISLTNDYSVKVTRMYKINSGKIKLTSAFTTYTIIVFFIIATGLLIIFTIWISRSIAIPVKSIIRQIRALGEGEVDLSKRIAITSKDEIGVLSKDFNELMEEIHSMATFKKVIEEDDSLEDVYSRLGKIFSDKLGFKDYVIYEVANSQNKMKPVYPIMLNDKEIFCNYDILSNCNLCKAVKTGHLISPVAYPRPCKQFCADTGKSHVCIPMIIGGSAGGVVQFLFAGDQTEYSQNDRRLFKASQYIKESISVLEAKRLMNTLRESALKDTLTGLYNRRFLQEYTETLVAGITRRGKSVGLIMCDLDYFKQVNDVYGHNVGDTVLKETSATIKNCVRASDIIIRFGGEEFLALMLDIQEGDAFSLAEKIRQTVQEAKIKVTDGIVKKTISLGVSEFPQDTEGFWQAIKFADVALYRAKETGRNKSVRFTPDMWTEEQF